uniref:RING-type E3 ubiquitin transferase n=1 Tax=Panagrellus redivivus TaxID=6233 RepID=A0A7E4ZT62_PANRE
MGAVASCVARILPIGARNAAAEGQEVGEADTTTGTARDIEEGVAQRISNGSYFGTHFLMGGERFDVAKPDVFLFGDNSDLEMLGNKPVPYPYNFRNIAHTVKVLNSLVNVRRDSIKLVRLEDSPELCYRLEFIIDADSDCYIQMHFLAKELVDDTQIHFTSKGNHESSERFYFNEGSEQLFNKFLFYPDRYQFNTHYEGGLFFPIVIEVRSIPSGDRRVQVQATMCSVERSSDQAASVILKPVKQKLITDGVTYLLQEIYGIEKKESNLKYDNSADCIICMANSRDTVILPCRHLCICNGCAETLRFKLQNCPICRSPFKALFKFAPMPADSVNSPQSRLTLIEALNGPLTDEPATPHPIKRDLSRTSSQLKSKKHGKASSLLNQPSTESPSGVEIELQPIYDREESTPLTGSSSDLPHTTIVRIDSSIPPSEQPPPPPNEPLPSDSLTDTTKHPLDNEINITAPELK